MLCLELRDRRTERADAGRFDYRQWDVPGDHRLGPRPDAGLCQLDRSRSTRTVEAVRQFRRQHPLSRPAAFRRIQRPVLRRPRRAAGTDGLDRQPVLCSLAPCRGLTRLVARAASCRGRLSAASARTGCATRPHRVQCRCRDASESSHLARAAPRDLPLAGTRRVRRSTGTRGR